MISAIFIITEVGDVLISHDYRHEIATGKAQASFVSLLIDLKPPNFLLPENEHDGCWSYNICRSSLYLVAISLRKANPIINIGILSELYENLKHFCGVVSEDTIKENSILVYEILLEFMDYGYVQVSSAGKLRPLIYSEPAVPTCRPPIADGVQWGLLGLEKPLVQGDASNKPFFTSRSGGELVEEAVYLDVVENLSVFVDQNGTVKRTRIIGKILLKNFLSNSAEMKLGLNKDLNVQSDDLHAGLGSSASLNYCDLHEQVNLEAFEKRRILQIQPSQGEMELMNYEMNKSPLATIPFRLQFEIGAQNKSKDLKVSLALKSMLPMSSKALQVVAKLRVPTSTTSLMSHLSGVVQTAELDRSRNQVVWKMKEFGGGIETRANFLLVDAFSPSCHFELGPLSLQFELSSFLCSGLQVQFMKVDDHRREPKDKILSWVRYVTHTNSYVFLLNSFNDC